MKRCGLAALLAIGLLSGVTPAAEKRAPRGAVAIVLDCSLAMNEPAVPSAGVQEASDAGERTRMDAAQLHLRKMLRDLAADGGYDVGLWLYGHRLAWEPNTRQPDLLSQDTYLEKTVGFGALNGLLPGDDVEKAHPIKRFGATEYETFVSLLDTVKPWGEQPMYLAINKALEALADQPPLAPKYLIVITSGANYQKLAKNRVSQQRVREELTRTIVPVHFIHVGPEPQVDDSAEADLREIAEQGGGTLVHVRASDGLIVEQVLASSRKVVSRPIEQAEEEEASAPDPETAAKIAEAKALFKARPVERTVTGTVIYGGKPVANATVALEGTDVPQVKTDRQGRFLLRKVPSGQDYRLKVKGIARNKIRETVADLSVAPAADEQPLVTIELE